MKHCHFQPAYNEQPPWLYHSLVEWSNSVLETSGNINTKLTVHTHIVTNLVVDPRNHTRTHAHTHTEQD